MVLTPRHSDAFQRVAMLHPKNPARNDHTPNDLVDNSAVSKTRLAASKKLLQRLLTSDFDQLFKLLHIGISLQTHWLTLVHVLLHLVLMDEAYLELAGQTIQFRSD